MSPRTVSEVLAVAAAEVVSPGPRPHRSARGAALRSGRRPPGRRRRRPRAVARRRPRGARVDVAPGRPTSRCTRCRSTRGRASTPCAAAWRSRPSGRRDRRALAGRRPGGRRLRLRDRARDAAAVAGRDVRRPQRLPGRGLRPREPGWPRAGRWPTPRRCSSSRTAGSSPTTWRRAWTRPSRPGRSSSRPRARSPTRGSRHGGGVRRPARARGEEDVGLGQVAQRVMARARAGTLRWQALRGGPGVRPLSRPGRRRPGAGCCCPARPSSAARTRRRVSTGGARRGCRPPGRSPRGSRWRDEVLLAVGERPAATTRSTPARAPGRAGPGDLLVRGDPPGRREGRRTPGARPRRPGRRRARCGRPAGRCPRHPGQDQGPRPSGRRRRVAGAPR